MIYRHSQLTQNMIRPLVHSLLAQLPLHYLLHVFSQDLNRLLVNRHRRQIIQDLVQPFRSGVVNLQVPRCLNLSCVQRSRRWLAS